MSVGLTGALAFGPVEGEKLRVAGQVVSPVAAEAALAFGAKGAAEQDQDPSAAGRTGICDFMGPERQQPHEFPLSRGGAWLKACAVRPDVHVWAPITTTEAASHAAGERG